MELLSVTKRPTKGQRLSDIQRGDKFFAPLGTLVAYRNRNGSELHGADLLGVGEAHAGTEPPGLRTVPHIDDVSQSHHLLTSGAHFRRLVSVLHRDPMFQAG